MRVRRYLTEEDVRKVVEMRARKYDVRYIAGLFKVTPACIYYQLRKSNNNEKST